MLYKIRMKRGDPKNYTTECTPYDAVEAPLDAFYPDTKVLNSMLFDTAEFMLSICDRPFAEGEVDVAFPPLPFVRSTQNKTRFEIQNERGWRLRTSSEYPATQAFIYNVALGAKIIAEERPIYFGMSAITESDVADGKRILVPDTEVADKAIHAAALAALDDFLRTRIRPQRGAKLTSRQILAVWKAQRGGNLSDDVIDSVQLTDIAPRFRAVFGVIMEKRGTRIDDIQQRYWDGYIII